MPGISTGLSKVMIVFLFHSSARVIGKNTNKSNARQETKILLLLISLVLLSISVYQCERRSQFNIEHARERGRMDFDVTVLTLRASKQRGVVKCRLSLYTTATA